MANENNKNTDILRDLEEINNNLESKIMQDPKIMQSITQSTKPVTFTDFRKMLDETNQSVRPIVEAFCESYIHADNMDDPKVQQRINIDSIALSEILWKKAISDVALIQLMERMESGDDDFKMYDSLSKLLSAKDNMPKELLQTVMVLEKNYKELKSDLFEQKKIPVHDIEGVDSDSLKFRGTKTLLQALKNANDLEESRKTMAEDERIKSETEDMIPILKQKPAPLEGEITPSEDVSGKLNDPA